MKNSDLATVTSSKEVFAIQRAHAQFLPQGRAAEEPLQDEVISSYEATVGAKTKNKFSQINAWQLVVARGRWPRSGTLVIAQLYRPASRVGQAPEICSRRWVDDRSFIEQNVGDTEEVLRPRGIAVPLDFGIAFISTAEPCG